MDHDHFEQPTMACPRCGTEMPDFDGFGCLFHLAPDPGACGWCSHPARSGRPDGSWVCDLCGDVRQGKE